MWYALAALALIIYGPRLARAALDSAADWSRAGKSLYAWSQGAGGFLASNSGWLKISASFLVGVVVCYVVQNGVRIPTIDWPVVIVPEVVPVEGPRRIIIGYESANASPAFKGALIGLRSGAAETALKAKGHSLDIIDIDEKDKDGNPTKAAVEYRASYPSLQIPVIIFRDQVGKVLHSEPLPTGATTASIMAIVEKH